MNIVQNEEKANLSVPETEEQKDKRLQNEAAEIAESEDLKDVFDKIEKLKAGESIEDEQETKEIENNLDSKLAEDNIEREEVSPNADEDSTAINPIPDLSVDKLDVQAPQDANSAIKSLKKEKYILIAEKIALKKRTAELEQLLNETFNNSVYHHSRNVYNDLDKAKAVKKAAIQSGDEDAYLEADVALHKATIAVNELERLEAERKNSQPIAPQPAATQNQVPQYQYPAYQQYQAAPDTSYQDNELQNEIIRDWIKERPELDRESALFNPKLTQNVIEYTNRLDAELQRSGQQNLYLSEAYFNNIDNYLNKIKTTTPQKAQVIQKQTQTNIPGIGAVRASQSLSPSSPPKKEPEKIVLTADEKDWIRQGYLTEKELIKQKRGLA